MILRGKDVEHHNVVSDMMMTQQVTYRPQYNPDGTPRDPNMVANVTVGFVKDAKSHIDVQGFNVYHKNRLIKPFWRVWHPAGSDGRGVIGVLEANFVEPAHDKQGFERTLVLSRLETKLAQMQKTYWTTHCHKIGYAPRQTKKSMNDIDHQPTQATNSEKSTELNVAPPILENKVHNNQNGQMEKQNMESKTSGSDKAGLSNNGNKHTNTYSPNQNGHMEKQNVESRTSGSDKGGLSNNGNNHKNTYSQNQNGHMEKQNVESRTSGSDNAGLSNNGNNHKNTHSQNQNGHMVKQNVESRTSGSDSVGLSNNGNNHNIAYSPKSLPLKRVHEENSSQTVNLSPYKKSRSTVDVEATNVDNNSGNQHCQKSLLPIKRLPGRNNYQAVRSFPLRMSRSDDDDKQLNSNDNHGNIHSQNSLPAKKLLEKISPQTVPSSPHRSPPTLVENNGGEPKGITANVDSKSDGMGHEFSHSIEELTKENHVLRERLRMKEREFLGDLLKDLDEERNKRKLLEADLDQERNKCNVLEAQLLEAKRTIEEQKKEQDDLIDIFSNERKRRVEEENIRKKLKDALNTIKALQDRA